eukprot:4278769-Pyramimonas_sp.AAC.1
MPPSYTPLAPADDPGIRPLPRMTRLYAVTNSQVYGNVSKVEDAKRIVATVIDHWGRLDVLVNNAGSKQNMFKYLLQELIDRLYPPMSLET